MRTFIGVVIFLIAANCSAAFFPNEHAVLNYNRVVFFETPLANTAKYELKLFADSVYPGMRPVLSQTATGSMFRISGLVWGKSYFWKISSLDTSGNELKRPAMHSFKIMEISYQGLEQVRLSVRVNDSLHNAGGLIAIDYTRCVYDRNGTPVWTIPTRDTLMDGRVQVRDLRMTEQGTFTFLTGRAPMEIDLDGTVLWQAPYPLVIKNDTIVYHHDFQKTKQGTYMVMGFRKVYRAMQGQFTEQELTTADVKKINGVWHQRTQLNMLLEFDASGKLIWMWDSNDHLNDNELNTKRTMSGLPNFATHANAFGIDDERGEIYISYRDLSRISCIDKKTGAVKKSWGEYYCKGEGDFIPLNFRKQHGAFVTAEHNLFIYNNNNLPTPGKKNSSSILEIQPSLADTSKAVLWRMGLDFDTLSSGKGVSGGNVMLLPAGTILTCAGTLNRLFEVDRNKTLVWDAFVEARRKSETWQPAPQYRANYRASISSQQLLVTKHIDSTTGKTLFTISNIGDMPATIEIADKQKNNQLKILYKQTQVLPAETITVSIKLRNDQQHTVVIKNTQTQRIIVPENIVP